MPNLSFDQQFCAMGIIYLMLIVSLLVALFFLFSFLWATKSGQFDDDYGPSVRILFDDNEKLINKKSNGSRKV